MQTPEKAIHAEACEVTAQDGTVEVTGPDDIEVRLTPDAAEETSERLLEGAMKARGQLYFSERRK